MNVLSSKMYSRYASKNNLLSISCVLAIKKYFPRLLRSVYSDITSQIQYFLYIIVLLCKVLDILFESAFNKIPKIIPIDQEGGNINS